MKDGRRRHVWPKEGAGSAGAVPFPEDGRRRRVL